MIVFWGAVSFYFSDLFVARDRFLRPEFLNRLSACRSTMAASFYWLSRWDLLFFKFRSQLIYQNSALKIAGDFPDPHVIGTGTLGNPILGCILKGLFYP